MEGFNFLQPQWHPLKSFGFEHFFFSIDRTTVINTWIVLGVICLLGICIRYVIHRERGILFHLIISFIQAFKDMTTQTLGFFSFKHFSFVTALFVYIVLCNSISLIPGAEEPTRNLNTTLALGLISFCYVQYYAITAHGFWSYIKEYFAPFFVMLPLNVVGKFASIISMSFRLYGNIFGGSTIAAIYFSMLYGSPMLEAIGALSGINLVVLLFFGLFEGVIQAFVFAMLSITYLSIAISHEEPEEQIGIP